MKKSTNFKLLYLPLGALVTLFIVLILWSSRKENARSRVGRFVYLSEIVREEGTKSKSDVFYYKLKDSLGKTIHVKNWEISVPADIKPGDTLCLPITVKTNLFSPDSAYTLDNCNR